MFLFVEFAEFLKYEVNETITLSPLNCKGKLNYLDFT